MKHVMGMALLVVLGLAAGCGKSPEAAPKNAEPAATSAIASAPGTPEAPREVKIEVGDSMKFSVTRFEAAAGETVRLLLVNTGNAPKEAMGHNWVLLRERADSVAYAKAAVNAKATDYIPAARAEDVIAHTKLIGGKARDAVVFTVPADATPGAELVYLCTFPAHLQLGMKGVLVVK